MSLSTLDYKHSFKAEWIITIDKSNTKRVVFETPLTHVDGMPEVKWSVKCVDQYGYLNFSFSVESKEAIHYKLEPKFPSEFDYSRVFEISSFGKNVFPIFNIAKNIFFILSGRNQLKIQFEACFWYGDYDRCSLKIRRLVEDNQELGMRLWKEEDSKDFSIHVDEKVIQIHKLILATESPVFARMFEASFKEAKESKVTITDFKYEIVQAAVNYCYRQDVSKIINFYNDDIHKLLYFADKYDFQTLKPKLEELLSSKISEENVSLFTSIAEETNSTHLQQSCIKYKEEKEAMALAKAKRFEKMCK